MPLQHLQHAAKLAPLCHAPGYQIITINGELRALPATEPIKNSGINIVGRQRQQQRKVRQAGAA